MRAWFFILTLSSHLYACTDFIMKTQEGTAFVGRSMEWGLPFDTHVITQPRGQVIQSKAGEKSPSRPWIGKYGYIGLMAPPNMFFDGFNEKGLSIGILWFPEGEYPALESNEKRPIANFTDLPALILSQCSSLDEVKAFLNTIAIYAFDMPEFKGIPTTHMAIHDASGSSLAVEFLKGELKIFENPVGVLTNSPNFPWQLTNLSNYVNLTNLNAQSNQLGDFKILPTGQGSGLIGLPGDWTPPSRFVRVCFIKNLVPQPKNDQEGLNLAIHLLNMVDIPRGAVKASVKSPIEDYTQWIVVKDLTHKKMYIRRYEDYDLIRLNLSEANIAKTAKLQMLPLSRHEAGLQP
jgi:choloylglycine hydrolase